MKPIAFVLGLVFAWAFPPGVRNKDTALAQEASPTKKVALLVGVDKYEKRGFRDLEYAQRDVEDLADVLRAKGYETYLLTGGGDGDKKATLANIQKAIELALTDRTKRDLVLIALAGHGVQSELAGPDGKLRAESFFCPVDAERDNSKTMLAMGTLFSEIERRGGGANLILVDACREDPTRGRGLDGSKVQALPEGVAVLFGCRAGQKTYETKKAGGGHGVFFHFVLEGLRGRARNDDDEVTWNRLAEYVNKHVEKEAPALLGDERIRQTPNLVANLPGEPPVLMVVSPTFVARAPTDVDRQTMKLFAEELTKRHLSGHPLDAEIAHRTVERVVSPLEGHKLYFLQGDIDRFHSRESGLADQLAQGDMTLAFEIFNTYLQRVRQRAAWHTELLEAAHDFSLDESLAADFTKVRFPANEIEARELWRKRVKYELLTHKAAGASDGESRRRARRQFANFLWRMQALDSADVQNLQADALALAYDPHSTFISLREATQVQTELAGQLFGLGITLRAEDGYVTVISVFPRGPAGIDGRLKAGDRIVAVGQGESGELVNLVGAPLAEAVKLTRGDRGTRVRLRVLPQGELASSVYTLRRDKVDLSRIGSHVFTPKELPEGAKAKVGYIYLPTLYRTVTGPKEDHHTTTADVERILAGFSAQGVEAVVLDMRQNSGGSLTEAIFLPGLFVGPEGTVLQVKGRDDKVQAYLAKNTKVAWRGPLVLVTSRRSAGGAEILAGAIQDYRRGLVVGDAKTHGLGTVAELIDLTAPLTAGAEKVKLGQLKVVTQKFYRPSGRSTQLRGIVPDIVLPSSNDLLKLGEEVYANALKFDEVPAGKYEKTEPALSDETIRDVAARSAERRKASPFFQQLAKQLADGQPSEASLRWEAFLAAQKAKNSKDDSPTVTGIPEVRFDAYLREVLSISLDLVGPSK